MTTSRTSRAAAGVLTGFVQYAFLLVLQFTLAPLVLRVAGQEVLGAYSFLMQIISWAALTDLGFGVAVGRSLAQANGLNDQRRRFCATFTTGRTFYLGSNLAFALLILFIGWRIDSLISMSPGVEGQARVSLYLLAGWVATRVPVTLFGDALIATQNIAAVNIVIAIGNLFRLTFSLALVALGAGLIGLLLANIIAEALTFTLERAWYCKLYPDDKFEWGIPDRVLFLDLLGFGLTYMVMVVAGRLSASTDSIIVGSLYGAAAVSTYYTSQVPGTTFYQLLWKVTDSAAPALNELYARGAMVQVANAYLRLLRYSLLLVLPLALGLLAFNRYAITLWVGPAQYAGSLLTVALSLFAISQVIIHLNAIVLVAYGNIRVMSILALCTGIIKVIFAFWLGHAIGLAGVMLANALSDVPGLIYLSYRVGGSLGLSIYQVWDQAIAPALRCSLLSLLVILIVTVNPPILEWSWFVLWVSVFALAWLGGLLGTGLLPTERRQLRVYAKAGMGWVSGKPASPR